MWIERTAQAVLARMARSFPVVMVTGPRQVGKTSLLRKMFARCDYLSLDLPANAEAAKSAPAQLLADYATPLIVDEIQYAPELMRYLKHLLNENMTPGQYLLTGSQVFPLMQGISESLAGRCGILNLNTLSFAEIAAHQPETSEIDYIFTGGYPDLHVRAERDLWYPSYVATYIERDVRNVLNITDLQDFNRFLRVCALRNGQIINFTDMARDTGIAPNTAKKWTGVLQTSGLIALLEPYFGNRTKRLIKSPKLYFLDPGLAVFLAGFKNLEALIQSPMLGACWESFVVGEIWRHFAFKGQSPNFYHWRTTSGAEVDIVIEHSGNKMLAIECKLKEQPSAADTKNLQALTAAEGAKVETRFIVCRTPANYQLPDGTWVANIKGVMKHLHDLDQI